MKKDKSKKRERDDDEDEKPKKGKKREARLWDDDDDEDEDEGQFLKLNEGKNTLFVLPNKDDDDTFFEAFAVHYVDKGDGGFETFRCTEPGGPFGHNKKLDKKRNYRAKKCRGCKTYCRNKSKSRAFEFGSPKGKKFWSEKVAPWRAKHQFVMAVCKPKSKEDKAKVFVWRTGIQAFKPLDDAFYDEDGVKFTNPKAGNLVKVIKKQLSKRKTDVEYTVRIVPSTFKLPNWSELKGQLPDLKSFLPEELSEEAQQAIIDGEGDADDYEDTPRKKKGRAHDDDDADLDDDDDDDESDRKLKLGKRRRGDDEDVDPDADEEEDEDADLDEDDMPRSKKSKKLRDKLKAKANRDDDDDEEESDDDEDEDDDDEDEDEDLDDEDDDEEEDDDAEDDEDDGEESEDEDEEDDE